MKTWTTTMTAACFGLAVLATPALADSAVKQTRQVSYAGLDLNTIEGQKQLEQRVEIAARAVCGYNMPTTGSRLNHEARACLAKARASAREQVAAVIEDQQRGG